MTRCRVALRCVALSACIAVFSACSDEDGDGESNEIEGWFGATEHMKAAGEVGGRTLLLDVSGDEAKDLDVLACERNYATGELEKVTLKYNDKVDDEDLELAITFAGFDFTMTPSDPIAVGGANGVDLKLELLEDGTNLSDAVASGKFTLELLSGTAGEDGIIPGGEGQFAGYLDALLESGADFQLSFTANCGDNVVE